MKFKFTGDPRSDDNQPAINFHSRTGKKYHFELNGPAVDVDAEDVWQFEAHSHFKPAPGKPKKKAKKKAGKR